MPLIIVATKCKDRPLEVPLSMKFGPEGGIIGRGTDCDLVLPDTSKHVSRFHARVVCREGQFFLVQQGANPTQVNDRILVPQDSSPIASGDRLVIGPYQLMVEVEPDFTIPDHTLLGDSRISPGGMIDLLLADKVFSAVDTQMGKPHKDPGFANTPALPIAAPPAGHGFAPERTHEPKPARPLFVSQPVPSSAAEPATEDLYPPTIVQPAPSTSADEGPSSLNHKTRAEAKNEHSTADLDNLYGPISEKTTSSSGPTLDIDRPSAPVVADPLATFEASLPARSDDDDILKIYGGDASVAGPVDLLLEKDSPSAPIAPGPSAAEAGDDDLPDAVMAFFSGAQMQDLLISHGQDPAFMHRAGTLLREAIDALHRAYRARERAAMNQDGAEPASVDATHPESKTDALVEMLVPPVKGKKPAAVGEMIGALTPRPAAIAAGVQAVAQVLIQRTDPAPLELRVPASSWADKLAPARRKMRLWELYRAVHAELAGELAQSANARLLEFFQNAYDEVHARRDHRID